MEKFHYILKMKNFEKKKNYCVHCGRELENNSCSCDESKIKRARKSYKKVKCDTCKSLIFKTDAYCPYCGIPQNTGKTDDLLFKELRGEFSEDVLVKYGIKDGIPLTHKIKTKTKHLFNNKTFVVVSSVFLLVMLIYVGSILRNNIISKNSKEILNNTSEVENEVSVTETETETETEQYRITKKDSWKMQDGYYYCFKEDGLPAVDEWIEMDDANGEKESYYFDIDGKLVVNSWIDGEYFVGKDGAMLKNAMTPDGAMVDANGKVIIRTNNENIEETRVYYESPNSNSPIVTNQKSSSSGVITGIDSTKTYELYINDIKQIKESVEKDNNKCNIIYYKPEFKAENSKEEAYINETVDKMFSETFRFEIMARMQKWTGEIPKSIVLNKVRQGNINANRAMFFLSGKIIPRKGLSEKVEYRFVYDRKSKTISYKDITN